MKFPYSEKVLEHFRHPRNVGQMENPDGKATEGSPSCGDMVSVYIKVDEDTKAITDIKFESYGCASNIATGSIITELAKGKSLEDAKKINWKMASEALGGLKKIMAHCSVLAVEGLRAAIQNYEERHGLVKEKKPTTEDVIHKRLRKVMNPLSGLDLERTNLVKDVRLRNGVIRVAIDLPPDHQFAPSIKDEISEKLNPLWDIKEVVVDFIA
jgi:NifU-like protein involved in Fe-S cluster formation